MKKFVFVYYGSEMPDMDEKQKEEVMAQWTAWYDSFKDNLVDGGNPFGYNGHSVTKDKTEPIAKDMWPARGYTIINAEDMEAATKVAAGCPMLAGDPNGAVRVYEAMPM